MAQERNATHMTSDNKHPEPKHAGASSEKLPEHLRHLSEGAIIDWLIRTGQWDPTAPTTFEVPAAPVSGTPPPAHSTTQDNRS